MKRLLNVVFIAFALQGVTGQSFDHDSINRMPRIGPGFLQFHRPFSNFTKESGSSVIFIHF